MAQDSKRKAAISDRLRDASLDALAAFSTTQVLLLTGYCPVMGTSVAIVTREGRMGAIVPEDEMDLAQATSDAELIGYSPSTLNELTTASTSLAVPLRQLFTRFNLSGKLIGIAVEGGAQPASYLSTHRFRSSAAALLERTDAGASVAGADAIFDELEAVKTPIELDQIRRACRLAAAAFTEAEKIIEPGRREDEIAADVEARFKKVAHEHFERAQGHFFCMSGPRNSYLASGPTHARGAGRSKLAIR